MSGGPAPDSRPVFVLAAEDAAQAEKHFHKLPLVAAERPKFDLVELRPVANLSMLFVR